MIRSSTRLVASVLALILSVGGLSTFVANPASAQSVASKQAEATRIAAQLERLAERASILTEDYNEARYKAGDLEERTRKAQIELATTEAKAKNTTAALKEMSLHAYMRGGFDRPGAIGSSDPARAQFYLQSASNRQKDALDALQAARQAIAERQAALTASRDQARKNLATVNAKRKAAEAAEAEQRQVLARVKGELAQLVAADQARRANAARATPRSTRSKNIGTPPTVDVPPPNAAAGAAIAEAKNQLGKPYRYGGSGPDNFDCSGLTSWAWRVGAGKSLPHSSRAQYSATSRVPLDQIAPGDLVFFGNPIHHVGLYVGGGKMINAPQTGRNVEYANAFRRDLVGVGRVN